MKNEKIIFNGYIPFYNNGNTNIFEKENHSIFKDSDNKGSPNHNLFQKHFRSKIPIFNKRTEKNKIENIEHDKNNKKDSIDSYNNSNLLSQPNVKNNLFRKISLNPKKINLNSLYNKIHEYKNNNQPLTPLKNIDIDFLNKKINVDNYGLSKKEREIEKIKYLIKQREKDNKYNNSSITKNKNNTLNSDNRLNNCFTIFSLKSQPIIPQKKNNKTIDSKNKVFNQFSIKRNNKITSLPKMNKSNNKEKNKTSEINRISSKTFFNLHNKKFRTHKEEIKAFLKPINKKRIKLKNLISFDAYSLPGTERGKQKINQDSYLVLPNINNTKNCKIFGVFDGHGDNSDILSQEIRDYFIDYFSDNTIYKQQSILFNHNLENMNKISNDEKLEKVYNLFTKNNYNELNKLFNDINYKLHEKYKENNFCLKTGSTSNLVMIMNDKKENCLNKIISINLGDSKSLLITEDNQAIDLNAVHNPEDLNERERIEKNGGEISRVDWADYGPLRVFYKGKHYPGLAMTRAFGDFNAEPLGINTIPDIREYDIFEKKPKIIVLATDGVWQFLTNEKVKNILLPYYDEDNISGAAQKLVRSALRMWENKNPNFIDDITVIILFFR